MAAWVADLQAVGYAFPPVRAGPPGGAKPAQVAPVALPRTPQTWQRHRDIVLVVAASDAGGAGVGAAALEALRAAYRPLFGRVVFTGGAERPAGLPGADPWVACHGGAQAHYACLANVMQQVAAPAGGGYLMVTDDSLLAHCQVGRMHPGRVWFQRAVSAAGEDLTAWLDAAGEKGEGGLGGGRKWHFSPDDVEKVSSVLETFRKGGLKSTFGVEQKLGGKVRAGAPQRTAHDPQKGFPALSMGFHRRVWWRSTS